MSGPGLLTLAGNNAYSGSTTITAGALSIGNGGTGESLASPGISDSGTLVFNHSDALDLQRRHQRQRPPDQVRARVC